MSAFVLAGAIAVAALSVQIFIGFAKANNAGVRTQAAE